MTGSDPFDWGGHKTNDLINMLVRLDERWSNNLRVDDLGYLVDWIVETVYLPLMKDIAEKEKFIVHLKERLHLLQQEFIKNSPMPDDTDLLIDMFAAKIGERFLNKEQYLKIYHAVQATLPSDMREEPAPQSQNIGGQPVDYGLADEPRGFA